MDGMINIYGLLLSLSRLLNFMGAMINYKTLVFIKHINLLQEEH